MMNIEELKKNLTQLRVRSDAYSLTGGLPNESYVIHKVGENKWETYYSERGIKSNLRTFENEQDACNYFLELITTDQVIMSNLNNQD
jgi:hypothetical protein